MKKLAGLIGQNLWNGGNTGIVLRKDVQLLAGLELFGVGRYDKRGIIGIHAGEKRVVCPAEAVAGDAFEGSKIIVHRFGIITFPGRLPSAS